MSNLEYKKSINSDCDPCTSNADNKIATPGGGDDDLPSVKASNFAADSVEVNSSQHGAQEANNLGPSKAAQQLAEGFLSITEGPLKMVRSQLKELIARQNVHYVDLSAAKHKLDCAEVAQMQRMMDTVKVYKDKLHKIRRSMLTIHRRMEAMKKRASRIEARVNKERQRQLTKLQQEEALIGKHEEQNPQTEKVEQEELNDQFCQKEQVREKVEKFLEDVHRHNERERKEKLCIDLEKKIEVQKAMLVELTKYAENQQKGENVMQVETVSKDHQLENEDSRQESPGKSNATSSGNGN